MSRKEEGNGVKGGAVGAMAAAGSGLHVQGADRAGHAVGRRLTGEQAFTESDHAGTIPQRLGFTVLNLAKRQAIDLVANAAARADVTIIPHHHLFPRISAVMPLELGGRGRRDGLGDGDRSRHNWRSWGSIFYR